jgi:serine/threonine protein kinase
LSSEKKQEYEEIKQRFGFYPEEIVGKTINGYTVDRYIAHGTIGVVFHAVNKEIGDVAACKIIPQKTLKDGWKTELEKLSVLSNIPTVVQYKAHGSQILTEKNVPVVYILYQYFEGSNLERYAKSNPDSITLEFIRELIETTLDVFKALKSGGIIHGDFHEGNIIIADPDPRRLRPKRSIMINDFGIGGSTTKLEPKDDYLQLSRICCKLIETYIDPAVLDGWNRFFRDRLLQVFLRKQVVETDPTVGDHVRNPEILFDLLEAIRAEYDQRVSKGGARLRRPFDYLSCEQIGDAYELLQTLYSKKFPGYDDLLEKTNTILTGPRGCGKSTIFRNLSLKTQLLAGKQRGQNEFLGIYYNCNDLYYAFPYSIPNLGDFARKVITHYFNLAILEEILDTLAVWAEKEPIFSVSVYDRLSGFLRGWFKSYEQPPTGVSIFRHLLSQIIKKKEEFRSQIDENGVSFSPQSPLPQDFLQKLCSLLQDSVPKLKGVPFYFFLDDYSVPRVSKEVQATLNCFILTRSPELYFKISTESIVSIYLHDATGKTLDKNREYDVIDLGDYFLFASDEKESDFLSEVINSRLKAAKEFDWETKEIIEILGTSKYASYNELARAIQDGKSVEYSGWKTVVDLCSGDVANILRLVRNMFTAVAESDGDKRLISSATQDKIIRESGNDFLNKIESVPETGRQMRQIVQAFGDVANHYLKSRLSKNVEQEPPFMAFRLEMLETPSFEKDEKQKELIAMEKKVDAEKFYNNLIKYGIFIQDVRGKSQRGAVVPRLYLRRLLIPTFVLTPSKRDSIRVDNREFILLLSNPLGFVRHMKTKKPRRPLDNEKGQKRL